MTRILAVLVIVAVWAVASAQTSVRPPATLDLIGIIDRYSQGQFDQAVAQAAAIPDLGPLRLRFVQDTPAWIVTDPARAEARTAAVAAFLLELAGARLESDWGRFADLIEWTCVMLRNGAPTEFERSWHAASHALAGRARVRQWMLGEFATLPHQQPSKAPPSDPQHPPARHLMHAVERFPEDAQFQLSRIVAWTWGRDGEPIRNVRARDTSEPPRVSRRLPAQLEAVIALEPLTKIGATAAEAFVRIGVMQFVVRDFGAALRAWESAHAIATEPAMKYIAFLNAGRALEALNRPAEAMRAYQRALEIVPDAESATIALTSLQFASDERETAVATIDRVFNRRPSAADPGRLIGYGSYLRWNELKASMRAALASYSPGPK
ncbi:MAG TPA: tetratricopeptide repeat protein [Vicinamibacterales bacterium]|nr:tetratricopeptide repeat protein [Vicinamibacterales bacterium]